MSGDAGFLEQLARQLRVQFLQAGQLHQVGKLSLSSFNRVKFCLLTRCQVRKTGSSLQARHQILVGLFTFFNQTHKHLVILLRPGSDRQQFSL